MLPKIKKPMLLKKLKFTSSKCLKVSIIHITILCLFFLLSITPVIAEITGPHGDSRIKSPKGVCATCHIPHNAKGPKIWARTSKKPGPYDGIHQLCQTCHDGTMFFDGDPQGTDSVEGYTEGDYPPINGYKDDFIVETRDDGERDVYASTGTDDVFDELDNQLSSVGPFESHVMHGGADITLDEALIDFDSDVFPLDPNDKDNFPESPVEYRSGGAGFYCGTCHNPHKQPDGTGYTGGFYLRTKPGQEVGDPWNNRKPFCSQCHGDFHFSEPDSGTDCLTCHHPHLGNTLIKDDEYWGRKILRYPVVRKE
ncbi:MAG: cytochrome c3 family protein, partial [bacterium]